MKIYSHFLKEVFSINKHTKTTAGDKRLLPHRLFPPGMDLYSCAWVPPHCLRFMGTSRWSPPWCPLAAHNLDAKWIFLWLFTHDAHTPTVCTSHIPKAAWSKGMR